MTLEQLNSEIKDLLDTDDVTDFQLDINVGRKADNVSISNHNGILRVEGWKGHKECLAKTE